MGRRTTDDLDAVNGADPNCDNWHDLRVDAE